MPILMVFMPPTILILADHDHSINHAGGLMTDWIKNLDLNPINILLSCDNPSIEYFTRKDLLEEDIRFKCVWEIPVVSKILKKQHDNGYWKYRGKSEQIYVLDKITTS